MANIELRPVLRLYVECPKCSYEFWSDARTSPGKRITCSKCKIPITVPRHLVSNSTAAIPKQKVSIPKGIPFDEEMKVINALPAEQRIRYFLALAREANNDAEREVALTAARDIIDEEAERGRNSA